MSVYSPASAPFNRASAWVEQLILSIWDNIMFALWGGVAGYMLGHLLVRVTHPIAIYIAETIRADYSLRGQFWVYYLTLWGSALCFAYLGVAFAVITKRRPEPEEPEPDLQTEAWGEPLEMETATASELDEPATETTRPFPSSHLMLR